ncbi:MAG: uridine kinase [Clostridia bacterium]|nr:uridine kinase [Clostridia bacterium]
MDKLVIGICGGTGSGKTTLARRIYESVGEDAVLIGMDSYYKNNPHLSFEERCRINYDHPDAFDTELLLRDLRTLKQGGSIECPTYDYTRHLRAPETVHLESRRLIILEGILLFADPEIVQELDVKIFVDTDADVRILRRILRDVNERGRSLDSVITQYLETVKPMHDSFIEPSKRVADIIVPEGGFNHVAFDVICSMLQQKVKEPKRKDTDGQPPTNEFAGMKAGLKARKSSRG